jgi:predicted ATPase
MPERQQTLRKALAWSYDLLPEAEQRFFRVLSIFVGGCELAAVEAVCGVTGKETFASLDGVASLLDKSFLQRVEQQTHEPRFHMLETVREYGLECLAASGEMEAARRAHALYYVALVEEAEPYLERAEQGPWLDLIEREMENVRAVFHWALARGQEEITLVLRLGSALWQFWVKRGAPLSVPFMHPASPHPITAASSELRRHPQ